MKIPLMTGQWIKRHRMCSLLRDDFILSAVLSACLLLWPAWGYAEEETAGSEGCSEDACDETVQSDDETVFSVGEEEDQQPFIMLGDEDDEEVLSLWDMPLKDDSDFDGNAVIMMSESGEESISESRVPDSIIGLNGLPDPTYIIEEVEFSGNRRTTDQHILDIAHLSKGDYINLSVLEESRLRLLSSGLFSDVRIQLERGSSGKYIKIIIEVQETHYFRVNNIWLGTSQYNPFWLGADLSYRNFLGMGHGIRMAFLSSTEDHFSLHFSYFVPRIASSSFSLGLSFMASENDELITRASKPGMGGVHQDEENEALNLVRIGGNIFSGYRFDSNVSIYLILQSEYLKSLYSSSLADEELMLPGKSVLSTLGLSVSYDTRDSRTMPGKGHFVSISAKASHKAVLSDYSFLRLRMIHQSNFTFENAHTLRLGTFLGYATADAPYFEKFFIGDFYDLIPGRMLNLNLSARPAYDLFKTGAGTQSYEDLMMKVSVEYAYILSVHEPYLNRMEIFFQLGVLGGWSPAPDLYDIGLKTEFAEHSRFPVNGTVNAGLRMETSFGFFVFSLSKLMDLIPR